MKRDLKKMSTEELHALLDNYQETLLRENKVLTESTKLLGNDKIAEILLN